VVKVSKGIKEVSVGQVLKAITTDPGALTDFPAWAKANGHQILKIEEGSGETYFFIKRLK
jgi:tRNA 2-thiouridine synthesizing protein A